MVEETDDETAEDAPSDGVTSDTTTRRIRTLAIFFLGVGVYAIVGAGLDQSALLLDNLTTYFVSGIVVFGIGLLLSVLTRL
ncbi:hypothetical protein GJ629_13440 [Halapricum sp. CBA1109]|uniref:hypothetical protein n=1 Tax=Halapricum sp. CBA1109 TaxID=2668068 RepID=UPI0012FC7C90|nr:hypothetical protein [Halapricum sp. CBA1109]MUV90777.1 hypothetical protein [Halapricum sp. CBA1109]